MNAKAGEHVALEGLSYPERFSQWIAQGAVWSTQDLILVPSAVLGVVLALAFGVWQVVNSRKSGTRIVVRSVVVTHHVADADIDFFQVLVQNYGKREVRICRVEMLVGRKVETRVRFRPLQSESVCQAGVTLKYETARRSIVEEFRHSSNLQRMNARIQLVTSDKNWNFRLGRALKSPPGKSKRLRRLSLPIHG